MSKGKYSDLQVLRSAAGFYIGRTFKSHGFEEPGSRESEYFPTHESAEKALKEGFVIRECIENDQAYESGDLPDLRKKAKTVH